MSDLEKKLEKVGFSIKEPKTFPRGDILDQNRINTLRRHTNIKQSKIIMQQV